jgi:hypothetical protein
MLRTETVRGPAFRTSAVQSERVNLTFYVDWGKAAEDSRTPRRSRELLGRIRIPPGFGVRLTHHIYDIDDPDDHRITGAPVRAFPQLA